jgi:hypothetical protein
VTTENGRLLLARCVVENRWPLQLLLRSRPARTIRRLQSSGIGREGGKHSREFFTEAKTDVMEI